MLILSRKESERIYLGDDVVLTIVRIQGDKVRIGVEAPSDVRILRRELEVTDLESSRLPKGVRVDQNRRAA
jgi:carbon storage regulator